MVDGVAIISSSPLLCDINPTVNNSHRRSPLASCKQSQSSIAIILLSCGRHTLWVTIRLQMTLFLDYSIQCAISSLSLSKSLPFLAITHPPPPLLLVHSLHISTCIAFTVMCLQYKLFISCSSVSVPCKPNKSVNRIYRREAAAAADDNGGHVAGTLYPIIIIIISSSLLHPPQTVRNAFTYDKNLAKQTEACRRDALAEEVT